jgi:hypothetical protein
MNWRNLLRSILISIVSAACVDRLSFDLDGSATIVPVVVGYISDQPGPYQVTVSESFDIELDPKSKKPLSVKSMTISDNTGLSEELTEVKQGLYETSPTGIRGVVGRTYKLRVELPDGKVYESITDTLLNSGALDSIYFDFVSKRDANNAQTYGFDIFFNSSATVENNFRFLWKFTGTYKAETNPELSDQGCYDIDGRCNFIPPCTGIRNVAVPAYPPEFERIGPCECCTCWYDLTNNAVTLNDDGLEGVGRFIGVKLYSLPLDAWIFTHKVHYKIEQFSITRQTFGFWKSIKDQQDAVNSIFQPINGKIPSNFRQVTGNGYPLAGIFYAASVSSKSSYIYRYDVPKESLIPTNKAVIKRSCLEAFPNSTNVKPPFWED